MILEHLILARDSSIDREKNTVSLFDLIEELSITSIYPAVNYQVQLFMILKRDAEVGPLKESVTLVITAPNGDLLTNAEVNLVMMPEHKRTRLRMNIELPIQTSGDYKFKITAPGVARDLNLTVAFLHQPAPPESSVQN